MLIIVGRDVNPEVGAPFVRYLDRDCCLRGEVISVSVTTVLVDFGNSEYEFDLSEVSMVHTYRDADHLMTASAGRLVADYRAKDLPKIEDLSDLLDFDKWLGDSHG